MRRPMRIFYIFLSLFVLLNSCSVLKHKEKSKPKNTAKNNVYLTIPENLGAKITFKGNQKFPEIKPLSLADKIKEVYTLEGHRDGINAVIFTPDRKYIITGSSDKSIKVWSVKTGKEIKNLLGHSDYITSLSITKDGKYLASSSWDGTVNIWSLKKWKILTTLEGKFSYINSVAFSPTDKIIAFGGTDKKIFIFDYMLGELVQTLEGHTDSIHAIAFSPDGKLLASGGSDQTIRLWDVETGALIKTINGHKDIVKSLVFSPDGKLLISGSWDSTIKVWNVKTGTLIKTLKGNSLFVNSVAVSPSGEYLASAHWDNSVILWNLIKGRLIKKITDHKSYVTSVAFSPDGKLLASGSNDFTAKIYKVTTGHIPTVSKTKIVVLDKKQRYFNFPANTFLKIDLADKSVIVKNVRGKLVSGEVYIPNISLDSIVIYKPTPLYKTPYMLKIRQIVPPGTIVEPKKALFYGNNQIAYVEIDDKMKGFIKTDYIAKVVKTDKIFILAKSIKNFEKYPGEKPKKVSDIEQLESIYLKKKEIEVLPLGLALEGVYYVPYLKEYYVKSSLGEGWIKENYIQEVQYETLKGEYVALKNARILLSPLSPKELGKIYEGTVVKPKAKIKLGNKTYYYVHVDNIISAKCRKPCMGYVDEKSLLPLKKATQKELWTKRDTNLYLSPNGTVIFKIEKGTKVIPEYYTTNYYKVQVPLMNCRSWNYF
jgi:WD40 repeat protein